MKQSCFQCGKEGSLFHGYIICPGCKTSLRLFTESTIQQHDNQHKKEGKSYAQEISDRLDFIEKKYTKAKIKLLHIQEKLRNI